jgi:hypothetical protein
MKWSVPAVHLLRWGLLAVQNVQKMFGFRSFSGIVFDFRTCDARIVDITERRSTMSAISHVQTGNQFPEIQVESLLRQSLEEVASDTVLLRPDRPEWEPLLDSQRVVGVVIQLERLLNIKIPPDKVVQKGGYQSVNQAVRDIVSKVHELWINRKPTRKLA